MHNAWSYSCPEAGRAGWGGANQFAAGSEVTTEVPATVPVAGMRQPVSGWNGRAFAAGGVR
jgi:hypothetical protein